MVRAGTNLDEYRDGMDPTVSDLEPPAGFPWAPVAAVLVVVIVATTVILLWIRRRRARETPDEEEESA